MRKTRRLITHERSGMRADCCCGGPEQSGLCLAAADRNLNDGVYNKRAVFSGLTEDEGRHFLYGHAKLLYSSLGTEGG